MDVELYNTDNKDMKRAGLFFFLLMILELPVAVVIYKVQDMFPDDKSTLISVLFTQGYLLIGALIYIVATRKKITKDLGVRKYKISTFFLSLLVLICAAPMANCLNVISQFFAKNETSAAIYEITSNVPFWLAILIIGCLPGFIEELIYRGIMYSSFRRHSILAGAIISALSFGLMHLNFNQMLYAVYLGLVFAFIAEATGSLLSTMILHMLFNAVNTSYLYLLPIVIKLYNNIGINGGNTNLEEMLNATPSRAELVTALRFFAPFAVVGLFLTIAIIKKIADINGRELSWKHICSGQVSDDNKEDDVNLYYEKYQDKQTRNPINVWLILGWLFCIVISIAKFTKSI